LILYSILFHFIHVRQKQKIEEEEEEAAAANFI
jgi:hypothetical protein